VSEQQAQQQDQQKPAIVEAEKEKEKEEQKKTGDLRKETDPEGYDRSYAQNLYGEAQSDYLKYLTTFKDTDDLTVGYDAREAKGKTDEEKRLSLLFSDGDIKLKDVKLVPRNYTALQYDHIFNMKAKGDDFLRKQTMPPREMLEKGQKLPEGWDTLLQDKAKTESEYYRDGVRIFYNIMIDGKTRSITEDDSARLDRTNRKVAVDLAYWKSETGPKKSATS
jgi:hypothetical protein